MNCAARIGRFAAIILIPLAEASVVAWAAAEPITPRLMLLLRR